MSFHLRNINSYFVVDSVRILTSDIKNSIEFYESISLINSYRVYGMEEFVMPIKHNVSDWNEFYNISKHDVYLDKNKIIKFKNTRIYLEKNPVDYLNSFIEELDVMLLEKNIKSEEFDYIVEKLEVVTKLECNYNKYDFQDLYKCLNAWKNWIKENSSKLYWNKGTQEVIVK